MAKAWKMAMEEEELCTRAVKRTPKISAAAGLDKPSNRAMNCSVWDIGMMACFIRVMPSNSIPKPMTTSPMYWMVAFFTNRYITVPTNKIIGAYEPKSKAVS